MAMTGGKAKGKLEGTEGVKGEAKSVKDDHAQSETKASMSKELSSSLSHKG